MRSLDAPATIDVERLLVPINGGGGALPQRCEPYLTFRRQLKDERRRQAGLMNDGDGLSKAPDWQGALAAGIRCLEVGTKDLDAGIWMCELLIQCHGFKGLRDGLRLLEGLLRAFPEMLYPQDIEVRQARLAGVNGRDVLSALDAVPLVESSPERPSPTLGELMCLQGGRPPRGLDRASFEGAFEGLPLAHFESLDAQVRGVDAALECLRQCSDDAFGAGVVTFTALSARLEALRAFLEPRCCPDVSEVPEVRAVEASPDLRPECSERALAQPPKGEASGEGPSSSQCPWQQALDLLAQGRVDVAITQLQGAYDGAKSGRDRFLARLRLAEFCIHGGLTPIARPLMVELMQEAEQRRLGEWERPEVWARLCAANLHLVRSPSTRPNNPQALQIFDQLARVSASLAFQHLTQHSGDIQ